MSTETLSRPEFIREILISYKNRLTLEEISEKLDLKPKTVQSRLSDYRKSLREEAEDRKLKVTDIKEKLKLGEKVEIEEKGQTKELSEEEAKEYVQTLTKEANEREQWAGYLKIWSPAKESVTDIVSEIFDELGMEVENAEG